jgi:hypothetical protein
VITGLYASLCALLIVKLSLNVVGLRRKYRVRLGDGGQDELQAAIRTQGNAVEYIPITLILMLLLELAGGAAWLIHLAGLSLLTGRLIHRAALTQNDVKKRVLGMRITLYLIIALSVLNIGYFVYGAFISS